VRGYTTAATDVISPQRSPKRDFTTVPTYISTGARNA
jgi:hypothetical protein